MRAAWYLARAELRRSWKGASAVVLVLGILWGLTIGFAVGARRNATAFRRMIVATRAVDILVNAQLGAGSALDFDAVTHLPEVDEYDGIDGYFATVNTDDPAAADADGAALWLSTRRGVLGQQFERTLLLEGRRLDPKGADEILVNPEFTRRFRVGVGDQFTFSLFDPQANRPIVVAHRTMRVVGVFRMSDEIVKEGGAGGLRTLTTPAFYRQNKRFVGYWSPAIRLRPGTDIEKFKRRVNARTPNETIVYQTLPGVRADVDRSNRPQVLALVAFAAVLGLGTLLSTLQVLAQLAGRRNQLRRAALDGIGTPNATSAAAHRLVISPLLAGGAVIALAVGVAISSRFPVGVVRRIETQPGTSVHVIGLLLGVVVPIATLLLANEFLARRRTRARGVASTTRARTVGSPWPLALALRAARAAPRMLAATTVAASLAVGGLVFTASLRAFTSTPNRFGWRWDSIVQVDTNLDASTPEAMRALERKHADSYRGLRNAPGIAAASIIRSGQVPIGRSGVITSLVGFDVLHGDAVPQIVSGRMPGVVGEIAIGPRIARANHLRLGDEVPVGDGPTATMLRVVGTVALPGLGFYSGNDAPPVGASAVTTLEQFERLIAPGAGTYAVVRYDAALAAQQRHGAVAAALGRKEHAGVAVSDTIRRNVDVVALDAIRRTPLLLVATLTVLTLTTLVQALVADSRRRRRSLAVLSVLGAVPRNTRQLLAAHAIVVVAASMAVGGVVGVAIGRLTWRATAYSVGVLPGHVVPLAWLMLAFVSALVLGWMASWWPSRHALRGATVALLRAE